MSLSTFCANSCLLHFKTLRDAWYHKRTFLFKFLNKTFAKLPFETLCNSLYYSEYIDLIGFCFLFLENDSLGKHSSISCRNFYYGFLLNLDTCKLFLQYHKEVVRLMSGEFRQKIGDKYISFARKWMNYVLTKCESGRGTRPR